MKFRNFKPFAKSVLSLLIIISLVGNAYADPDPHNINNLSKPGGIALSWDDSGNVHNCYQFLPIFEKYNATCTMNVNKLTTQARMNELNALHLAGWEIASHGFDHLDSAQFISNNTPLAWLDQEIFPSIVEISNYNHPVRTLAYPYSSRNVNTDAILAPYFRTLRTDVPRVVNGNVSETILAYYKWDDARLLYGVEIDDPSGVSLQSIEHGIDHAIKTGTVLVLYGHEITPNINARYQTSTARLDSILSYTSHDGGVFYHMGDLGNSSWEPLPRFSNVTADYIISTNSLFAGKSVTFKDYSVNQTTEMLDFGDDSPTSSTANVIHMYATPGIYTAKLTVTNDVSSDSMLKTITIIQPTTPDASFTSNSTSGIQPLNIVFIDKSTGYPTSWLWDFGDGDTSTSQNPVHEYSSVGNYSVALTVKNEIGSDRIQKVRYITVLPDKTTTLQSLSANFNSNVISENAPLTVQFTDTSTGFPTSWDWSFGDGSTSNDQSPSHIYSAAGTYNVNLKVSNANGTESKTATIDVPKGSSSDGGSSHSSGGSGGGAGGSPEPQNNVEIKEISQIFVGSGDSVKFEFLQKVTPVVYISFDSKKTAGKITTIVEMLKDKSTLTSDTPNDEVYKFLNIWVGNSEFATPKNIENAIVCFKVEKSWIKDKNIDQSSITLNRYSDKAWNQLPTSLSGEDEKYLYFTAQAPEFSPFAITGKTTAGANGIQPASGNRTQPDMNGKQNNTSTGSTATNAEQTPEQTQNANSSGKLSTKIPDFEISSGIICLLCVFLYKKGKKE